MRTYEEGPALRKKVVNESDTEITLGMKSILGIFFGLALICGVFFGFGYSLGRGNPLKPTASAASIAEPTAPSAPAPIKTVVEGSSSSAGAYNYVAGSGGPAPTRAGNTLPVKPSAAAAAVPPQSAPAESATVPAIQSQPLSAPPQAAPVPYTAQPTAAPAANDTANISSDVPANIMVQIAAVSRKEDADALVAALRKLGYSASARAQSGDNLLHVQIGPFATLDQAKAMRARLLNDGYNAILK